ncbi:ABC transporter permease [Aliikangiella marina]|uniref:ABC transporter permease n=1 Tax=Aliikangiella marina TaxID=1712262 RepID=UPI00163D7554|nr:ABC transporter permease [Aliikangiella marina]
MDNLVLTADDINTKQPSIINIYLMESKSELLRLFRTPGFYLPTLLFPMMFYLFFGVIFSMNPATMPTYLLATYSAFGVIGPALFSFGVGIAVERGQGWFDIKEASPMPASAYIISRISVTIVFSLVVIALLFALGAIFGGVRLYTTQWLLLAGVLIIGSLPFCAIGLALGLYCKSNSAPAVVNLIYLPMGFLSGLWMPINFFPQLMQDAANLLPAYHFAQLSLKVIDMDVGANIWIHLAVMLAYFAVFMTLAAKAYYKKDKQ